jgi:mannosyltransferase OCH1-like enzyme
LCGTPDLPQDRIRPAGFRQIARFVAARRLAFQAHIFYPIQSDGMSAEMDFSRLLRFASIRCVQLFGNLLKFIFYVDILLRPAKRYRIPDVWPPLLRTSNAKKIPRIVWQTNYTKEVTLSVYVNYLFNRFIAPTYEFRFYGDSECEEFVKASQPSEMFEAYSRLQIGAAKADLWRVLVLLTHGGVYLDADAAFCWPPEFLLRPDQTELFILEKDRKLTNYFLAAAPNHPVLAAIAYKIVQNIQANSLQSVYDMTGPTVVDEVARSASVEIELSRSVCRQGQFTKKVFQYPDKLKGYWGKEQAERPIVRPKEASPSDKA